MNIVANQTPIKIFNRQAIEKACAANPFAPVAIISITDVCEPLANIPANYNIRCCLRLQFEDVFEDEAGAMCPADACDIAQFAYDIDESHIEADEIWIHCEGGVSRSAAVAAAISKHFFGDDIWVFSNPAYYPNMWVNKLVTEALGDEWDYKEFIRKLNINIQHYKEQEECEDSIILCAENVYDKEGEIITTYDFEIAEAVVKQIYQTHFSNTYGSYEEFLEVYDPDEEGYMIYKTAKELGLIESEGWAN